MSGPFGVDHEPLAKNLTQEQIDRKKKVQSATSITTSTLGLTALGATAVGWKGKQAASLISRATKGKRLVNDAKVDRVVDAASRARVPLLTTSAGIGGVGGYNFASYTRAEAKQKKKSVGQ